MSIEKGGTMSSVPSRPDEKADVYGWAYTDCLDSATKSPGWPVHVHTDNADTADTSAISSDMERVRIVRGTCGPFAAPDNQPVCKHVAHHAHPSLPGQIPHCCHCGLYLKGD